MLAPISEATCAKAWESSEGSWAVVADVASVEICPVETFCIPQSSSWPDSLRSVRSAAVAAPASVRVAAVAAAAAVVSGVAAAVVAS